VLGLPRPGPEHTLPAAPNTQTEVRPLSDADAVGVGAGHNGLVAANLLVDAGWEVVVLEAEAALAAERLPRRLLSATRVG